MSLRRRAGGTGRQRGALPLALPEGIWKEKKGGRRAAGRWARRV